MKTYSLILCALLLTATNAGAAVNAANRQGVTNPCAGIVCPAVMVCNSPLVCDPATGQCVPKNPSCNDNNACTADSCDPARGCIYTPIDCNDNNACTMDSCNSATGCVNTPTTVVCDDNNPCTTDSCDPATGACVFASKCQAGETCDPAVGACVPSCPAGSVKSVTIRGGGQSPRNVDLQIQTTFTVTNDGCIVDWTPSAITCSPGTVLTVNVKAGRGPMPTSCTWNDAPMPINTPYVIECPAAAGELGKLICDNKDGGGKDVDRMTVTVQ